MLGAIKKLFSNGNQRPAYQLARNDDCWCGSGKKYKRCHIDKDRTRDRVKADACRSSS